MPIYEYIHPKTGEIFEKLRPIKDRNKPYVLEDGTKCKRLAISGSVGYFGKSAKEKESFELDRDYVKKCNPKYIRFRDGHRERYDPTKHN